MKILLLGKNGQVGWELQRALAPLGELIALDRAGNHEWVGDLTNLEGLASSIRQICPDVIVNAAAHTAVDKAESEPDLAFLLNAKAPEILAAEAQSLGALLVHYSTDYVFSGSGVSAWSENDQTAPINVYGRSKLAGELAIQASGCRHLIFRTSWVYAARGGNFAKTMLRLGAEKERLAIIDDQFGAPTSAELIADVTAHAIRQTVGDSQTEGIYHLVAGGEVTWHGYAKYVLHRAKEAGAPIRVALDAIDAVPTAAFPTPAQRPNNSRLSTRKLQQVFQLVMPHWQAGVDRMLLEFLNK